jgi:hypothetical protein
MALWEKVRHELDRAGKVAQGALDEGRIRLDAFRARQLADKAAQALGYALYRARQSGRDIDPEAYTRLSSTLAAREAEAAQHEAKLADLRRPRERGDRPGEPPAASRNATTDDEGITGL